MATTKEELHLWLGWVESKMRQLILKLDQPYIQASPFPYHFTAPDKPFQDHFFIGLKLDVPKTNSSEKRSVDLSQAVRHFKAIVCDTYVHKKKWYGY